MITFVTKRRSLCLRSNKLWQPNSISQITWENIYMQYMLPCFCLYPGKFSKFPSCCFDFSGRQFFYFRSYFSDTLWTHCEIRVPNASSGQCSLKQRWGVGWFYFFFSSPLLNLLSSVPTDVTSREIIYQTSRSSIQSPKKLCASFFHICRTTSKTSKALHLFTL